MIRLKIFILLFICCSPLFSEAQSVKPDYDKPKEYVLAGINVESSGTTDKNIFTIVGSSVLLYILFILITKCQIYMFFIILLFLGVTYIISIIKQQEIENSKKGSGEEPSNKEKDNIYDTILFVLYIVILCFTFIGVIMYMGEKKIEYKKNFNYITFFIGKSICKGKSPKVNMIESFTNAFY
jgi:hypothetical protein